MESLTALWLSILVILGGAGLGRLVRGFRGREDESLDERLVLDAAIGLGVYSLIIFTCGALQLLKWKWFALVLVWPALLFFGLVVADLIFAVPAFVRRKRTRGDVLRGLLLLVLALAALVPAMTPPAMTDWDSLAYHLSIPKLWIEHGGFYPISFASHSNFPSLTEMLYVPGLYFHEPAAAKMVHYWIGVLLVAAVAILARRHFGANSAWMAAMALAGMPIVLWEATTAYVDLATALYVVVGVHLLLNYASAQTAVRRIVDLLGCAACAGFAASTKMTGLAVIPLSAIWLLADTRRHGRGEGSGRGVVGQNEKPAVPILRPYGGVIVFVIVALAVCSPWYVKSYVYTGSPVYPFFYSVFGGRDWSAELARNYSMLQSQFGLGRGASAFLTLPYDLTFRSDAYYDTPGLFVGPLFLVAVPILILGRYGSNKLIGLMLFFLAQVVIWFALTQQSRYLIPASALLAVLVSAFVYSDDRLRRARPALWAVFAATALFGVWTLSPFIKSTARYVCGSETRGEYLTKTLDIYPAQRFMNDNLPIDAKVAFFGDTRGFYLDRSYVWADPGHNLQFSRRFATVDEFARYLRGAGITHAMVNFRFFPSAREASGTAELVYEAIRSGRFRLVYPARDDGRGVAVYQVLPSHSERSEESQADSSLRSE